MDCNINFSFIAKIFYKVTEFSREIKAVKELFGILYHIWKNWLIDIVCHTEIWYLEKEWCSLFHSENIFLIHFFSIQFFCFEDHCGQSLNEICFELFCAGVRICSLLYNICWKCCRILKCREMIGSISTIRFKTNLII